MSLADLHISSHDALFVDFDGTLAEIIDDANAVTLAPATAAALIRLALLLDGAVMALSGRDLRDLASRLPEGLWRAGAHGLEILAPGAPLPSPPPPPPESVLAPLRAAVAQNPGTRLEIKGPVAALHYRAAPAAGPDFIAIAQATAAANPGLIHQPGKMVVEVKPETAHKGRTLRQMMTLPPFAGRRPIMIGDDTTDEDAILAAQDLGGLGIKVGPGPSAAQLRAPDPATILAWLGRESR